jgi:hypothetical protein
VLPNAYVAAADHRPHQPHDPQLDRHIAPPVSSQQLASGTAFDDGIGVDASRDRRRRRVDAASLESGSFVEAPGAVVFSPDPRRRRRISDRTAGRPARRASTCLRHQARAAVPARPAVARRVADDAAATRRRAFSWKPVRSGTTADRSSFDPERLRCAVVQRVPAS